MAEKMIFQADPHEAELAALRRRVRELERSHLELEERLDAQALVIDDLRKHHHVPEAQPSELGDRSHGQRTVGGAAMQQVQLQASKLAARKQRRNHELEIDSLPIPAPREFGTCKVLDDIDEDLAELEC